MFQIHTQNEGRKNQNGYQRHVKNSLNYNNRFNSPIPIFNSPFLLLILLPNRNSNSRNSPLRPTRWSRTPFPNIEIHRTSRSCNPISLSIHRHVPYRLDRLVFKQLSRMQELTLLLMLLNKSRESSFPGARGGRQGNLGRRPRKSFCTFIRIFNQSFE